MIPFVALDSALVASLAVTGAASGALALLLAALALMRVRRLGRTLRADEARAHGGDLVEGGRRPSSPRPPGVRPPGVRRRDGREGAVRSDPALATMGSVDLRTELADPLGPPAPGAAICNVAVVRYDAFPDVGGQMSFSAALLDEIGDGLVLTVINGRNESRTYAKDIRDGTSVHRLSDDEVGAIDQALGRTRQP